MSTTPTIVRDKAETDVLVPKLNKMAAKLFANKKQQPVPLAKEAGGESLAVEHLNNLSEGEFGDAMDLDEKQQSPEADPNDDSSCAEEIRNLLQTKKLIGRKPVVPLRHRGAVGAIRLNQSKKITVYRNRPILRLVKQIVKKEFKREGIQYSADSVYLIVAAMENIMLRKAALGLVLSLNAGKSSMMPRYAMLGIKLQQRPDLRQWNANDYEQCDQLLERSQFRGTELDVVKDLDKDQE